MSRRTIGSWVLFTAGLAVAMTASWNAGAVVEARARTEAMGEAREALDIMDRDLPMRTRIQDLQQREAFLAERLRAATSSSDVLDRDLRVGLEALGLVVDAAAPWEPVELPEGVAADAAAFDRRLETRGPFTSVLAAVETVEAWPDRVRIRIVEFAPERDGRVTATMVLRVVRRRGDALASLGGTR